MCQAATNLSYIISAVVGYFLYEYAYRQGIKSQQEKIERLQKYIRQREEMDRKSLEDIQKWSMNFKQGGKKK